MISPNLLTPRQAAEKLGMSYAALKHWILAGRIKTIKTPGGHHRIPAGALSVREQSSMSGVWSGPITPASARVFGSAHRAQCRGYRARSTRGTSA